MCLNVGLINHLVNSKSVDLKFETKKKMTASLAYPLLDIFYYRL